MVEATVEQKLLPTTGEKSQNLNLRRFDCHSAAQQPALPQQGWGVV